MKEQRKDEREERRSRDQEKMKMKEKMREKRREKTEEMISLKNVSNQKNPPDEFSHNDSIKITFGRTIRSNLTVFSVIYMIRIRIYGPRELIQN